MKFSAVFLAGLSRAEPVQFLDFWTETDVFAFQIQDAVSDVVKGNRFFRKYKNLRQVLQHYQNSGDCEGDLSDPTYARVNVATFDEKLNEAANIENFVDMLDDWIQSYACIDKKNKLNMYNRAMNLMRKVGDNEEFQEEIFNFEVSNEMMSYTDALGYCFLKDMRLLEFEGEDSEAVRQMMSPSLEDGEWYWYDDDGCNAVEGTEALVNNDFDCETELYAICMTGQYGTTTTTTTTTPTTTTPVNYATVAFSQFVDVWSDYSMYDRRLSTSFLSDGSRKTQLYMKTPDAKYYQGQFSGYFLRTGFTMLNGEYYVFGGYGAGRNIFKFNGCALEQLEVTMPTQYYAGGAEVRTVVHADGSENAYICFTNTDSDRSRKCDSFDGTTAVSQPYVSSASSRQDSSMANYKGGLLVFGGWSWNSETGTSTTIGDTEILTPEVGFSAASPMITAANSMNSLTIGTDRVVMFGGFLEDEGSRRLTDKIFMYYNDEWSFAGNMVVPNSRTTAIMIESSIIVSSGQQSGVIQQFEWDGSSISEGRIVDDVGNYKQMMNPIVIPELFEECERPTNEFIFGAPLGETTSDYRFTALDFSLASLDYSETTPDYFAGVIFEMDSYSFAPGIVNYKGQIYMMGGAGRLWTKIFEFTGSTTEEVALTGDTYTGYGRLYGNNPVVGWQDNEERIFLCFNTFNSRNSCQTFDGSVIRNVEAETVYEHNQGCIGTFERNKEVVAIGGLNSAGKVEIFDGITWRDGPDQPNNLTIKAVSVDVGAGIITIGGYGDVYGYSAYLLTYDNMIENTKKWVDLGRLNSYYSDFSAFRFGEIIVAHRISKPHAGIYMLTWDGNNLEDHGVQIDLDLFGGNSGIFIPKEDTE